MNKTLKKVLKMVAVVAAVGMLGATLVSCGVPQADYDAQTKLVKTLDSRVNDLQIAKDAADAKAFLEKQDKEFIQKQVLKSASVLEEYKLELSEKDAQIAEFNAQIATELEAEGNYVYDELDLGVAVPAKELTSNKVSFLSKGKVEVGNTDYDYKEVIGLDHFYIATSKDNLDYGFNPVLETTDQESVSYGYVFTDAIPIADISEDDFVLVDLQGSKMEIIKVVGDEVTVKIVDNVSELNEGESVTVGAHKVQVIGITSDNVKISVDGVSKKITVGSHYDFNGFDVRVKETLYQDYAGGVHQVTLEMGIKVLDTIADGDEYKDLDNYEWVVDVSGGKLNKFGIVYTDIANDLDENVILPGANLAFLDLFKVGFEWQDKYTYETYKFSFDEVTDADIPALMVKGKIVVGDNDLTTAYLTASGVYYKEDGDWVNSASALQLENGDTLETVSYSGGQVKVGLVALNSDLTKLGDVKRESEGKDVLVNGVEYGSVEEDVLLPNGWKLPNLEGNSDSDKFELSLPDQEVKAKITLFK